MNNINQQKVESKPMYKLFFELVEEAISALYKINTVTINKSGIQEMFKELKKQKIKLAYGSLRIDRDIDGHLFIKEYRPTSKLFRKGYFYSIHSDQPLWENLGTSLIRLYHKKERFDALQKQKQTSKKDTKFCVILQGNLQRDYIKILLKQGRFSYNTNQNHLTEEPIFSALNVLSQISQEQIVETQLNDQLNFEENLNAELYKMGITVQQIACVVGKNAQGKVYTAPREHERSFSFSECKYKIVPIEIAKAIVLVGRSLVNNKGLLVLDHISYSGLWNCLNNREKYYTETSHT